MNAANKEINTANKTIRKPFKVVGKMSWIDVKLGTYKTNIEANKAIKEFESRKIYTNLRVESVVI